MRIAYGVVTVVDRVQTLLPKTLDSLGAAGFDKPRLFVDCDTFDDHLKYEGFDLDIVFHYPRLRTMGNWITALWELYIRNPRADRYLLFEDDIIAYRNLKEYLEKTPYPQRGYCNLYTFPENQKLAKGNIGWVESNQKGYGALGLMFDHAALQIVLGSKLLILKPIHPTAGHKRHDGAICVTMQSAGFKEYIHNPSLLQHSGRTVSTLGKNKHPLASSFRGADYDALELLGEKK